MKPKYETAIAQDEQEIAEFIWLLQQEQVASYLEIGARYGGSLWRIARSLPSKSRIVAIDLPTGFGGRTDALDVLRDCVKNLWVLGYDAHLFVGSSAAPDIVESVSKLAPFDCIFIDADHRLEHVTRDWQTYGPMGRIVAFHDISYNRGPGSHSKPVHVPTLWKQLKGQHRHLEIKRHPTPDNGIGVLWR